MKFLKEWWVVIIFGMFMTWWIISVMNVGESDSQEKVCKCNEEK